MTAHFRLPEQNAMATAAARLVEAGAEEAIVLGVLRKGGLSLIDSIKLYSELTGTPLVEAMKRVQSSPAWSHNFERDAALQTGMAQALRTLGGQEQDMPEKET